MRAVLPDQAEQRHLEAQTLLSSARAQLQAGEKELAGLQQQLQQGLAAVYRQARSPLIAAQLHLSP